MNGTQGHRQDSAAALARFQIGLYPGNRFAGGAIHDALAVGAAIDPSFMKTVHVESPGRLRVAKQSPPARHGGHDYRERRPLETVGVNPVQPNVNVAVGIDSDRFLKFLVTRLQGK